MAHEYPAAVSASRADTWTPEAAQARYDAARDLENALPTETTASCEKLVGALRGFAASEVAAAEWYDRLNTAKREVAARAGQRFVSEVSASRQACRGGPLASSPANDAPLLAPGSGEAFTGDVRARVPSGSARAELLVNGMRMGTRVQVVSSTARASLSHTIGPISKIEMIFRDASGAELRRAASDSTWLLPSTAWRVAPTSKADPALSSSLASIAKRFSGYSGMWVAHLATGKYGAWNETSHFPAASTVKLGVIAAALGKYRTVAQHAAISHELETIGAWSSNLAANRLFNLVGGEQPTEAALRSLGATSSSYTGEYRAGTVAFHRTGQPPLVSQRVTTAHDLGAMLETFVRLASGDQRVSRRTGLTAADGRLVIGLLLRSQKVSDNVGLFAPSVPANVPIAQKNGWISVARHTAAVLFTPAGPVVCVVVTYRSGITLPEAQRLGGQVVRLALG